MTGFKLFGRDNLRHADVVILAPATARNFVLVRRHALWPAQFAACDAEQINSDGRTWVQHAFASHSRGECERADDCVENLKDMDALSHLGNLVQRNMMD